MNLDHDIFVISNYLDRDFANCEELNESLKHLKQADRILKVLENLCLSDETYLEVGDKQHADRLYIDGCKFIPISDIMLLRSWLKLPQIQFSEEEEQK